MFEGVDYGAPETGLEPATRFLLRQTNRKMEAEALETRAKAIRAKQAQRP